jgi:hypothetical protein
MPLALLIGGLVVGCDRHPSKPSIECHTNDECRTNADRMIGGLVFELAAINHNFQSMSSGVWNTARERKKFFKLVELCKVLKMDTDPTDDPDYEEEDDLDDLLELTFLYGQSIGRTLGTAIDFTVDPLHVEDLDEIKAVNDFRKLIVHSCFIFLLLI